MRAAARAIPARFGDNPGMRDSLLKSAQHDFGDGADAVAIENRFGRSSRQAVVRMRPSMQPVQQYVNAPAGAERETQRAGRSRLRTRLYCGSIFATLT